MKPKILYWFNAIACYDEHPPHPLFGEHAEGWSSFKSVDFPSGLTHENHVIDQGGGNMMSVFVLSRYGSPTAHMRVARAGQVTSQIHQRTKK